MNGITIKNGILENRGNLVIATVATTAGVTATLVGVNYMLGNLKANFELIPGIYECATKMTEMVVEEATE